MATQYAFGSIVTNGLVLALNAADKNSYPGSGTTWTDMSGNGNNGTLTNSPTFSSANGGSIVFDGVDDYVSIPNTVSIRPPNTSSWNFWVYPTSLSGYRCIFGNFGTTQAYIAFHLSISTINLRIEAADNNGYPGTGGWVDSTTNITVPLNTYTNVSITYNGSNFSCYKNGSFSDSVAYIGGLGTNTQAFNIGAFWAGSWNGNIASAQIYNKVLSASEIAQNYNAQKSRFGL